MSNWPEQLPSSALIEGFSRNKRKAKKEFTSQGGVTKSVLFFSSVPEVLSMRIFIDESQRHILEDFYEQDTLFGTQTFSMPDPVTGETVVAKFIGDPPKYDPVGYKWWVAEFDVEVQP